ncbi:acyltransferase family protein [Salininema proteolyticum]|uniref:Acyltransferase family protein n=1 Tax=Salininema proteolyticum TaxID=1607685 RepID=A0ABV8TYA5_9ACTN
MLKASPSARAETSAPAAGRLDTLTGLRFYAALVVVLFHLSLNRFFLGDDPAVEPLQFALKNGGWFGVTFFFVLSGFVLTWSARPGDTPGRFLWRRTAKIVPNHLVMFAVALAVAGLGATAMWEAGANLLLLHAWIPSDTAFFSVNNPSWSLSAELFFYAMFPFALPVIAKVKPNRLIPLGLALVAVVIALPLAASLLPGGEAFGGRHAQSPLFESSIFQVWSVYALPPVRFLEFAVGMIAARAVKEGVLPRIPLGAAIALTVAGYGLSLYVPLLWQLDAVFVLPVALLVIAAAQAPHPPAALAGPAAVRLGELSFALYMVHDVVLTATRTLLGDSTVDRPGAVLLGAGVLAAGLGAAWLLWNLVEVPANRALRALPSRSKETEPRKDTE